MESGLTNALEGEREHVSEHKDLRHPSDGDNR